MEDKPELTKYRQTDLNRIAELESRLEELTDFIDNAALPLHWVDARGVIIWANQAELDLLGYSKEEYLGRAISDFHMDAAAISDITKRLNNKETILNYPARLRRKDGSTKHVLINSNAFFKNGEFQHTRCFTRDVTELRIEEQRKAQALVQLEHSQMRMNFLMQSINLGTWDYNPQSGELHWSAECRKIYGLDQDSTVDFNTFEKHIYTEDKTEVLARINEAIDPAGTGLYDIVFRIIRFDDKSVRWIRSQGKVYRDAAGQATNFIGTVVDITESKLSEQGLLKAEERARLAIDAVGLGTFDLDILSREMVTSEQCAKIFGFSSPPPAIEYVRAIHPDDQKKRMKAHEKAARTGHLFYEARLIRPDGAVRWVRIEGKVYHDTGGQPNRILGTVLDITEVVTAIQAQRDLIKMVEDHEQLLSDITSATPIGLWMADQLGRATYVNKTWCDWTGLTEEELKDGGWLRVIHPEDRESAYSTLYQNLLAREFRDLEFRFLHSDGTVHWAIANGKAQFSVPGEFKGFIGAFVDITTQKQLQRQKDEFIGIASHELKTPVTSIKAYCQLLEKTLARNGQAGDAAMMHKMDIQLNRLNSLISDLLDVTKINTGKLQFNDREFNFDELVVEVVEDLQRTTDTHILQTELQAAGNVFADRERISQVFINLITNAVKYSPQADRVLIHVAPANGFVTVSIRDFGIGVPEKDLDKVFDQYYRVKDAERHSFAGLGLGLYISSEIITREGGKIWVESSKGEGSTFYFSLPINHRPG